MILIVGGRAQGKLNFAQSLLDITNESSCEVCMGKLPETEALERGTIFVDRFNDWARQVFEQENVSPKPETEAGAVKDLSRELDELLKKDVSKLVLISDEIGCGIVPVDSRERAFREWMGRLQIELASQAEAVYRVTCGIGQRIK